MMINLRGTSGSGKTTAVNKLLSMSQKQEDIFIEGRKQPIATLFGLDDLYFAVLGHYNTPCGGCDTINKLDQVFELYDELKDKVDFVLAEGKILGEDTKRTLVRNDEVVILQLTTAIPDCYEGVYNRRIARGQPEDKARQKPKKLEKDAGGIASACRRLAAQGVEVIQVSRENIVETIITKAKEKKNVL